MDLGKRKIERVKYPLRRPERRTLPAPEKPKEDPIPVPNWPVKKPVEVGS